jgi:hypothetical protein
MAKQTINIGSSANAGDGEGLRDAFIKVNNNFDELYLTQDNKVDQGNITTSGLTSPGAGLLGRATGSTSAPIQNLTAVQAKTFLELENVNNTSDALKPLSNAAVSALAGKEDAITPGTTAQYWRGDKTFQTLNKAAVGLNNVDNTSDAQKPISTAVQTALDGKASTNHSHVAADIQLSAGPRMLGRTSPGAGTAGELTDVDVKSFLNITNVNNTSDAQKPISIATQAALDLKLDATGSIAISQVTNLQVALDGKASAVHTHTIQDVTGLQAALDAKASTQSIAVGYSGVGPANNTQIPLNPALQPYTISVSNSRVRATQPATVTQTRDIEKNGQVIGTVTWSVGDTLGTISIPVAGDRTIAYGDYLAIVADTPPSWSADLVIILRN